ERAFHQQRMIMPLHDDERVFGEILLRHVPRLGFAAPGAADADALALADRIERQTDVLADLAAFRRTDRTRLARHIALQKIAKRPLADKAAPGRILSRVCRQ